LLNRDASSGGSWSRASATWSSNSAGDRICTPDSLPEERAGSGRAEPPEAGG
jgi:hypothetical protein